MDSEYHAHVVASNSSGNIPERPDLKKWLVRRVECMRGEVDVDVEVFPAFSECALRHQTETASNKPVDYAQDKHTTEILSVGDLAEEGKQHQRVVFRSEKLSLELNATIDCGEEQGHACPSLIFRKKSTPSLLGDGITTRFRLTEGQAVSFIIRDADDYAPDHIDTALVNELQLSTHKYWSRWIKGSKYKGRWVEVVSRSLLLLKMLIFEPTGAIIAAPTFSLPEDFGGQ